VTQPATTVSLRLRGLTPLHLLSSLVSALPLGYVIFLAIARHVQPSEVLIALSALVALLPWLSRAMARAACRAKCDSVAVHVRGEALPYKTIREVKIERTARRTILRLIRSETLALDLVLRDAFAGRLEPRAELERRLAEHGHVLDEKT
jgi:hypothetical protein